MFCSLEQPYLSVSAILSSIGATVKTFHHSMYGVCYTKSRDNSHDTGSLILQIDPAYKMNPIQERAGAFDCALYTLHCGIAISNRPLEDDDESRIKREEQREQMQWLRSLEGR